MNLIGGLLGGVVGGLIGAAIWIAIGYWTGYEVGWIAWGIGALVGVGVQVGARRKGGLPGGGTAVILAIAAILAGKWAVVRIEVDRVFGGDDVVISYIADVIIAEHDERGETVLMPPETMEVDTIPETYPTSIWMQAMQRWQALDAQQQDELRALPALANDQLILVYIADTVVEEYEQEGTRRRSRRSSPSWRRRQSRRKWPTSSSTGSCRASASSTSSGRCWRSAPRPSWERQAPGSRRRRRRRARRAEPHARARHSSRAESIRIEGMRPNAAHLLSGDGGSRPGRWCPGGPTTMDPWEFAHADRKLASGGVDSGRSSGRWGRGPGQ
jgi:hypothetical protein